VSILRETSLLGQESEEKLFFSITKAAIRNSAKDKAMNFACFSKTWLLVFIKIRSPACPVRFSL